MTPREKHIQEMERIAKEIEIARGIPHRNDLIRQWQKMNKDLMEYDPAYVDVIVNRWEEFTGRKAELIHDER